MANPADLLHQTLSEWKGVNAYTPTVAHRIAIRHLDAIEELLDELDAAGRKTTLFRRYFEKWATLTLRAPHDWLTQTEQAHLDATALEHLEHLADVLDGFVPSLEPGGLDIVRSFAESARTLLDEDELLDPLLRQHVLQVIAHLNWCVDNYAAVGDFELREAVERLMATMMRTASTFADDAERVGKWRQWMDGFVYPFAVNVTAALPSAALTQLALGSGG